MKSTRSEKKWLAKNTSFQDDLPEYWGSDWGCDSEYGILRAVLLRRPGKEIENIQSLEDVRWLDTMDPSLARDQHDSLADFYRSQGISVHYVEEMREDRPNALFMRDSVLMTPEGAVVGRQAMDCRRGEERYASEALARLGVPVIRTVSGTGIFETACCLWINAKTVIIGSGNRSNHEGCRQIEEVLQAMGVEDFLRIQIPYGYAHIDSLVSFLDKETAVFDPARISWDVWNDLRDRGFRLLEAPSPEETDNLALNFVALAPNVIVMASGFPKTKSFLESNNIQVYEVDVTELRKGWGSLHCMTAVLKRERVGSSS
jgi:N-dimethylarginine dimethylaminohydrolase